MKISFLTRDLREDYPRIGWLPPLPNGAEELLERFGNLHCDDYPEMVIENDGQIVRMVLTAMSSGRTDAVDGSGRQIRVTLYCEGASTEVGVFAGFVYTYLREYLSSENSGTSIRSFWEAHIKPGDPVKWREMQEAELDKKVLGWKDDICNFKIAESCSNIPQYSCWMTGWTREGVEVFSTICMKLLRGDRTGIAFSLANLGRSDAVKAVVRSKHKANVAMLFSCESDNSAPLSEIVVVDQESPSSSHSEGGPTSEMGGRPDFHHYLPRLPRKVMMVVPLIAVLMGFWAILKPGGKGQEGGDPTQPTNSPLGSVTWLTNFVRIWTYDIWTIEPTNPDPNSTIWLTNSAPIWTIVPTNTVPNKTN